MTDGEKNIIRNLRIVQVGWSKKGIKYARVQSGIDLIESLVCENDILDSDNISLTSLRDDLIEKNTHLKDAYEQAIRERDTLICDISRERECCNHRDDQGYACCNSRDTCTCISDFRAKMQLSELCGENEGENEKNS